MLKGGEVEEEWVRAEPGEHEAIALERVGDTTLSAAERDALAKAAGVRAGVPRDRVCLRPTSGCGEVQYVGEILNRVTVMVDVDLVTHICGVVDRSDDAGGRTGRDGDRRASGSACLEDVDVIDVGVFAGCKVRCVEMVCRAGTERRRGNDGDGRGRREPGSELDKSCDAHVAPPSLWA